MGLGGDLSAEDATHVAPRPLPGDLGPPDGGGAITVASALTGTVTLTTIVPGHIVGSFDVKMAAYLPSGLFDTAHPTAFSGTFDSTDCPGTMQ